MIPVIDLLNGQVVRGVGGRRAEYRPVVSSLVDSAEPAAMAAALRERFGRRQVYVADLDAIERGTPDLGSWLAIGSAGLSLMLDAGISTAEDASEYWEVLEGRIGGSDIVIGLESLRCFSMLEEIEQASLPLNNAILSLDLRGGVPLTRDPLLKSLSLARIVKEASSLGILQFILLDLVDVGSGKGTSTLPLLKELCEEFPDLHFIAGGGVRGRDDLQALQTAGASGALVASALHDGRLTAADCRAFES